ncbi:serine protease [Sorangium cellulosum]|uniref:Serine protease n=1 Tax=Sorangium cellulosum TaxID=56 RepID=A0A150SGI9_SORCE|nr:serine protease [Sorangium cellulosum]KYF98184.1 serine protease [Sorangium cellulosum]
MRKLQVLSALLPLSLIFAGCVSDTTEPNPQSACSDGGAPPCVVASDKERILDPQVSDVERDDLAHGNTRFALDLYHELGAEPGNLFYSPYSISSALAMTYAGARTETEEQMASTLHFTTLSQERLHPTFNVLNRVLESRGEGASGAGGGKFQLNIANALWGQNGHPFLPSFLDVLAEHYGAGMTLLDFAGAAEASRKIINDWVAERTEDRIKDLVQQNDIQSTTRLVLTNAIYFNAAWKFPFDEDATAPGDFTLADGSKASVPMMTNKAPMRYHEEDGYQAVEVPYQEDRLSMVLVLPSDLGEFEAGLDFSALSTLLVFQETRDVTITLPKFRVESRFDLIPPLKELGMTAPFSNADFSGIDGSRNLAISAVVHKAFVDVNEAGTEAAAATAVAIDERASPAAAIRFDRPFVFFIRDNDARTILFVGRVADPSK